MHRWRPDRGSGGEMDIVSASAQEHQLTGKLRMAMGSFVRTCRTDRSEFVKSLIKGHKDV